MNIISDDQVASMLDYAKLADALDAAFKAGIPPPPRQQFAINSENGSGGHLLLMPAWQSGGNIGVKIVSVFADNAAQYIPTINATFVLLDGNTGVPQLMLEATEMTRRRTAAASALASRYLSRRQSRTLLMVGTGSMAPHLIKAHCAIRPVETVWVWGRDHDKACKIAEQLHNEAYLVESVTDLKMTASKADIISCATLSSNSLIHGAWLTPGQHLDLVGSFTPQMREVDDCVLRKANIFVDTRSGALLESGELVQGLHDGVISESDVLGDLFELAQGKCSGRGSDTEITLFKSVGSSLEDLVAASLVADQLVP